VKVFLGHAVRDGQLRFLSVSAIEKFDEAQGGCERKWGFRYIDGIKEPESTALEVGNKVHKDLEHYLTTGEDVLGPIPRAGKHLIYDPGPGLLVEHESLGELVVCGVPLYLKLDLENEREYYLDGNGTRRSLEGAVEVNDWKTKGNLALAKTGRELLGTVQMPVYGKWALERPRALPRRRDVVRLSHTYFGTRRRESAKSTILATEQEIADRWGNIEGTVERMIQAADVASGAELKPNWDGCRFCPYQDRCPRDPMQALADIFGPTAADSAATGGEEAMSFDPTAFLNGLKQPTAPQPAAPAPTPPAAPAAPDPAALAAEVARLTAQLAAQQAAPQPNVYLTGQQAQQYGQATGSEVPPLAGVQTSHRAAVAAGVLPGDVPASGTTGPAAKPIAPETLLSMPAPIQAAHQQMFPPAAASPPPVPAMPAPAPAPAPLPPAAYIGPSGTGMATAAGATPQPAAEQPTEKPKRTRRAKASSTATAGLVLYVDCISEGVDAEPLDEYVQELCDQLCTQFKAVDIRVAGDDTPLAFGKWKGVLSGFVRARPPKTGSYYVMIEGSEIKQIVVEALRPLCAAYVRGVR